MASVTQPPAYPVTDIVDVALRDGKSIHIRPVQEADRLAIRAFFEQLSSESLWFRFLGLPNLDWVTNWSVDVDYADRYALVATAGAERSIVAHGAYARTDADHAEVAFVVADAWQKHGIATIMLAHLAAAAERHGISLFTAWVTPSNHRMVQVFRDSGFPVQVRAKDGLIEVELPTSLGDDGRTQFDDRERVSATGVVHDESFGPVVACGAGGTSVELLRDVAVRITPLSDLDAKEMLRFLRSFPLLDGYRGAVNCDVAALEDILLRLSAMVEAHAEIAELDANPVVARADGALILDARIRVQLAPDRRRLGALRS